MKLHRIAAITLALLIGVTVSGCAVTKKPQAEGEEPEIAENIPQMPLPEQNGGETGEQPEAPTPAEEPNEPSVPETTPAPKAKTVTYITATSSNVNLRSGAGTNYSVRGTAEKSTLYALDGESGGWYKTGYKNGAAYASKTYCTCVEMSSSEDERIEKVIAEGAKLLGTAYVYGAVRLHDGGGNMLKNFTTDKFDCSSLMQYIFYKGAGKLLNVNTRTQISQGKTVKRADLKRGDLMFFTNASRKNLTGIERVGHVALYLGGNWILHTASDYAKIEQISSTRWGYFIQGQRLL